MAEIRPFYGLKKGLISVRARAYRNKTSFKTHKMVLFLPLFRYGRVRACARASVRACVRACVRARVRACVRAGARVRVRASVRPSVRASVRSSVHALVASKAPRTPHLARF